MALRTTKQYVLSIVLLVLVVGVFLFFSSAQVARDPSVSEESLAQSPLPSRAPVGYEVPARPVVTFPFTHVSADRLRLGNIQEVSEGEWPVLVTRNHRGHPGGPPPRRSPDGQWMLLYDNEQQVLSITKTDGSGEKYTLFTFTDSFITDTHRIFWSWDSNYIFYPVKGGSHPDLEQWVTGIDIKTGKVTRHIDIGYYDNLHSYATARYPTDPVLFSGRYHQYKDDNGADGIKTRDGTAKWVIDGFEPFSLSPNKQMVLGRYYDRNDATQQFHIYTADGSTLLYRFDDERFACCPFWSPDSSKFAYRYGKFNDRKERIFSELYIMNLDGTGKTQLTDTPEIHEEIEGWTPNGQIVFTTGDHWYVAPEDRWYIADLVTE